MTGPAISVRVQRQDFDLAAEVAAMSEGRGDVGAIVTFSGLCRDEAGTLGALELEHYPGMAEAEIRRVCETAVVRFGLIALTAIHRHGRILPGEDIVLVVAASPHRQAAFDGANFVMDFLKTSAPFWKKEIGTDGTAGGWVSAKDADDSARDRWKKD
ncbi:MULTISPECIES: molybdenum cofactor biosynthesis protein MoaE [unclassified Rhizobium]|uniref:molybdenum cofactor biosynthesis protein MoaE n=1 Tax=unclassified Rhizobium TaxID=2613769 RepID=UPI000701B822|nr:MULTISPECIES: molybdenum cofactor biosynthesis protein MoaE [unclassified Rhizobium]KQV43375.1 molybdopterin synthase catalytic subunit [Rhizobium sp. Root1212]KRD37560.1 molybdopterin synthase catalytic subunit [Rhizobium sp. Root268]